MIHAQNFTGVGATFPAVNPMDFGGGGGLNLGGTQGIVGCVDNVGTSSNGAAACNSGLTGSGRGRGGFFGGSAAGYGEGGGRLKLFFVWHNFLCKWRE